MNRATPALPSRADLRISLLKTRSSANESLSRMRLVGTIRTAGRGSGTLTYLAKSASTSLNGALSTRFLHLCRLLPWKTEELHEGPHARFLTAGRKSLGSCKFGDAVETRPKQLRENLWLRTLPLKQLQDLGKRESQFWRSSRVTEWYAHAERKHYFIQCG